MRHLTGDPPEMGKRATATLAGDGPLLLADLVLAECVYVLESFYEVPRDQVAELMRAAIALRRSRSSTPACCCPPWRCMRPTGLDFTEAYLVASAEVTGVGAVVSFDRATERVKTVQRIEP